MKTLTLFGLLLISGVAFGQSKISGTVWMSDVEPWHELVFRSNPDTVIFETRGLPVFIDNARRGYGYAWLVWADTSSRRYNMPVRYTAIFKR